MSVFHVSRLSRSLKDTEQLARWLAQQIASPAVILLHGDIGAGKSAFARAFIRAAGVIETDIPSPTFTLVQTYDSDLGQIWHSDLYRLNDVDEVEELGLLSAFEEDVCLIEWPDRLHEETPETALHIHLKARDDEDMRDITFETESRVWSSILETLP